MNHNAAIFLERAIAEHRSALRSVQNLPAGALVRRDLSVLEESLAEHHAQERQRESADRDFRESKRNSADPDFARRLIRAAGPLAGDLWRAADSAGLGRDSVLSEHIDVELRAALMAAYSSEKAATPIFKLAAERQMTRWDAGDLGVSSMAAMTIPVVGESVAAANLAYLDPLASTGTTFPIYACGVSLTTQRRSSELENEPLIRRFELLGRTLARTEARAILAAITSTSWAGSTAISPLTASGVAATLKSREAVLISGERPPKAAFLVVDQADALTLSGLIAGDLRQAGLELLPVDGLTTGSYFVFATPADARAVELRRPAWEVGPQLVRRSAGMISRMFWFATNSVAATVNNSAATKPLAAFRSTVA